MVSFRIEWKHSAVKELKKLPPEIISRIINAVGGLSSNPRPAGVKKLVGSDDSYRLRVGRYRIIYSIFENRFVVEVIRVGHRKEVYR
jgi:mRNA interferase RelE/StbE